jgi:predicted nucleic acid-binding protein
MWLMPKSPIVVCNTTPIIALALIGHLELLQQIYGKVSIPPSVEAEIQAGGIEAAGEQELASADWIHVVALNDPRRADYLTDLDRGEAEAIVLAEEMGANVLIMDERLGRSHARRLGLPLTGTLGVLIKAKHRGLLSAVKPLIDELRQAGIQLGDDVIQEALQLAGESH